MKQKYMAEFDSHRNDLFWKFYTPEGERLQWTGYDDANWWKNVSTREGKNIRTDNKGRKWQLNYLTDEVTLLN